MANFIFRTSLFFSRRALTQCTKHLAKTSVQEQTSCHPLSVNSLMQCRLLSSDATPPVQDSPSPPSQKPGQLADIKISDSCIKRLKEIDTGDGSRLRVVVEGGGCSGFQYKFELDSNFEEDDKFFEREGVGVVVDESSLELLQGSTVDFHTELIRSSFRVIDNPHAEAGCSCGASFSVKL